MVKAKSSQSRVESAAFGPGIRAFPRQEILFPNFRGSTTQDQESSRSDDLFYDLFYHKAGRAIARIAHFLLFKSRAFEKKDEEGLRRIDAIEEPNRRQNLQAVRKESQNRTLENQRVAALKWC
jgi:hypothetical protein